MKNFNNSKRDFFDIYTKIKNEHLLKNKKLKLNFNKFKSKNIFIIIATILIAISLLFFAIFNYFFGNFKTNYNFEKNCETLGVKSMEKINKRIFNIALFGVDKRSKEKNGRSDATMILTLDEEHGKIKLINLMRDSLVKIPKHGNEKLCHAFSYGNAQLAIKTINQNFDLDIFDYITVNFAQMADVINVIGGLEVKINKREADEINGLLNSTPGFKNKKRVSFPYKNQQKIYLTGEQVLQFCRIRGIDSDIKRVERQQYILNLVLEKIKNLNKTKFPELIRTILGKIDTSLKVNEILNFIPFLFKSNITNIQKCKVPNPDDKEVKPDRVENLWCWRFNVDKYTKIIHKFIYEEKSKYIENEISDKT